MADKGVKWLDRYLVTHGDHVNDLEQRAAELEFNEKAPRHEAEDRAYSEYKREQHLRGAAHHLRGLRAAQSSGDREDARKHSAMLELHAKQVGFDPYKEFPSELNQYMHEVEPEPVHRFKAHRGDLLVLDDHKKDVEKAEAQQQLGRILKKAELVLLLKGDVVKFPKDRVTPAMDQGRSASVSGRITPSLTSPKMDGSRSVMASSGKPLFKEGHRVRYNEKYDSGMKDRTAQSPVLGGTVMKVHPDATGQQHMYHVRWDSGVQNTYWQDQLEPHGEKK